MRFILIAAVLTLSACVATEQTPDPSNPEVSETPADGASTQTAVRTSKGRPKARRPLSEIRLIGQSKRGLTQLLGVPSFKRRDPPAEIWRYRDQTCLLDFYLYPFKQAGTGAPVKVSFVEARTPRGPSTPVATCLKTIHGKFIARKTS